MRANLVQLDVRMPDILDACCRNFVCEKLWWKHCRRDGRTLWLADSHLEVSVPSDGNYYAEVYSPWRLQQDEIDVPFSPRGDDMAGGGKLMRNH